MPIACDHAHILYYLHSIEQQILLWIESVPKITIAYRGSRVHASTLSDLLLLVLCVGKTRARDAALNAIQSPLLDIGIERATGIVWNITGGSDLTLFEVSLSLSLSLSYAHGLDLYLYVFLGAILSLCMF